MNIIGGINLDETLAQPAQRINAKHAKSKKGAV